MHYISLQPLKLRKKTCSQHFLKKSIHFPTSFKSACSMHALHCSCHSFLQHIIIHACQSILALWPLYPFLSHIQWSVRRRVDGETATNGEHISKRASEWPVSFSPVGAPTPAPHCVINPGNTTHTHRVTECVSWTFTEQQQTHQTWKPRNSVVPSCKCNSPAGTLQITNTRTRFTAVAWAAAKNALSKGSGSALTVLLQAMELPGNQWDYFPRVTRSDHLALAITTYEECPERSNFQHINILCELWSKTSATEMC